MHDDSLGPVDEMDDIAQAPVESDALLQPLRIGRDEMNLSEFPFAVLSKLAPHNVNTLEFYDVIRTSDGKTVERRWIVTGTEKYGLPTATDEEVYIALMEVTKEQGFGSRTVPITRYDVISRMGWKPDGRSYTRLEGALDRLKTVSIKAENAFWDNAARRYITVAFGIIDNYVLADERRLRGEREEGMPFSCVTWNEVIFTSFRAGNIKMLDTDMYFSLRSPIARRLYRYLDKKRYPNRPTFQMTLEKLAFEHLGMCRSYYPSQLKRKLEPAHRELVARGFLTRVEYGQTQTGAEKATYYFAGRQESKRQSLPPQSAAALEALLNEGVTMKTAAELIQVYPLRDIWAQISYLPYRSAREPAAALVQAIRESWGPPTAYLEHGPAPKKPAALPPAGDAHADREQAEREVRARQRDAAALIFRDLPGEEREAVHADIERTISEKFRFLNGRETHAVYSAIYNEEMVKVISRRHAEAYRKSLGELEEAKRRESR